MTWLIVYVRSTSKTKLSCYDQLDRVQSIMTTRQDNDITDPIGAIYVENKIELSWSIESGAVYHKN